MADLDARAAWVQRVLGFDVSQANGLAKSAARGREAQSANTRGIAYPKLLLNWRAAQSDAEAALTRTGAALLAMPDVQADPRFPRVQSIVAKLPQLIPELGGELEDLLDRGINAGTDKGIAGEALGLVATYRQKIAAASMLGAFEKFAGQHVGALAAVATLDAALADIAKNLQAAA